MFGRVTSLSAPSRRTISCEAVPPSIWPAGAQGGTSARRTGAALSFVSCIRLFGGVTVRGMWTTSEEGIRIELTVEVPRSDTTAEHLP